MVLSNAKKLAILAAMTGMLVAGEAVAADVTDVLDAADEVYLGGEKVSDPFDISLTPKFVQRLEWAKLKREYNDRGNIRLLNELEYERTINEFDLDLEIGMFHDLSLRVHMPIIISDQQTYKFDTSSSDPKFQISDVGYQDTTENKIYGISTLAPATLSSDRPYRFFNLKAGEDLSKKRAGFGDMSFGIAWSPYNTERHFIPERPWEHNTGRSTITLGFDYVAPTGKTTKIDNDGVGSGVHEFLFTVAASHRFSFVDPYIKLQYGLPVGGSDYKDYSANQKRVDPGMWGRIDLGIEFIPYEDIQVDHQRFFKIDLRGYFKYTAEGRAYSAISDALGAGGCASASAADAFKNVNGCGWLAEKWSNGGSSNEVYDSIVNRTFTGEFKEDGLFDYEGYARIGGALNLTIQPIQYVQIIAGVAADYAQNHFITFTKIGVDRVSADIKGNITDNSKGDGYVTDTLTAERNPTFSGALDRVGQRIKRTESLNLDWFVGLRLMY